MFSEVKNKLGFGCMRFPATEEGAKIDEIIPMIDAFLEAGFNYFDTARGYMSSKSENIVKECLTSRYSREDYLLADKLSTPYFEKQEDIVPFFESQLEACGVEYFDFYLMHAQDKALYKKYKNCNAYKTVLELKKQGKIKHFGISFHDKANVLEQILTENPEIEFVQIQFNYVDYNDASIDSKNVYEVCRKYNKPIIVMEPVKGGTLVNLPDEAKAVFDELEGSYASFAIRYAAGFPGVFMVLSGMGNIDMVKDNIGYMKDFKPLNEKEMEAVEKVRDIIRKQNVIPCTACRYCIDGCPRRIAIPDLFACYNDKMNFKTWNGNYYYSIHTHNASKASDCIGCGKCEAICPQHLEIPLLLDLVAKTFEK